MNKSNNSKNSFKEWLSDYLRYFILALALILAIGAIVLGVRLYQTAREGSQPQGDPSSIVIVEEEETAQETGEDGTETERETETETEAERETETESETGTEVPKEAGEDQETEASETETGEEAAGTESTVSANSDGAYSAADDDIIVLTESQRDTSGTDALQTEAPQTEAPQTEAPQTEPPTEVYEPVYLTMTGTCYFRSYADYGDNIIGEYPAGTVVEFLEDVGGWYKVQVDGMVGYMGARFFQ